MLFELPSFANIDSAYLGFNFDEVAGDGGWGLRDGSPFQTGVFEGHFEASLQDTGDLNTLRARDFENYGQACEE